MHLATEEQTVSLTNPDPPARLDGQWAVKKEGRTLINTAGWSKCNIDPGYAVQLVLCYEPPPNREARSRNACKAAVQSSVVYIQQGQQVS